MKVAIAGKGGSGKTTVAGTMARLAAGRGVDVVAVDADLNPNLALVLGMRPDALDAVTPLPHNLLQHQRLDGETVLRPSRPAEELVLEYGVDCPVKVRLLVMGRPQAGVGWLCGNHATVRGVLRELPADDLLVVVDMEASPEHLARSTAEAVDLMLVVAEPYFRSLETARRSVTLAADLGIPKVAVVANKLRDPSDRELVEAFCARHGMEVFATVPYDGTLGDAERAGAAPVHHDADGPLVGAIGRLVDRVLGLARW